MARSAQIHGAVRGRAAVSNRSSRFDSHQREDFDDGWEHDDDMPNRIDTVEAPVRSKTLISTNDSPDIGFDKSINPYLGCSHGCIYCFARPSHAYWGLSPGLDFETHIFFKPDGPALLERELSKRGYTPSRIQLGANTDPYQSSETRFRLTRRILEVLERFQHPVGITTKNALVTRDADILGRMSAANLAMVSISVTTLDRKLARSMEPRASTPEKRIEALKRLTDAGVKTMIGFAPVIPGLNDHELDEVLRRGAEAGCTSAHYTVLRLPREISELWREWLEANYPDRARRVMSIVQQMRGGKDYDPAWGVRMKGQGPFADLLAQRFKVACARYGLNQQRVSLDTTKFAVPPKAGDQLSLF